MKKLMGILLMLTCMIGLTACGDEKELMPYNDADVQAQCQYIYSGITAVYSDDRLEEFSSYTSDQYNEYAENIYNTIKIRTDGQVFINGIFSWNDAKEEIGTAQQEEIEIEAKEDELIVSIKVGGTIHDGIIEVIYDDDYHVTSITTNVVYSFGELMAKAGINTLIGMGTVFIILILISLIISCFSFIPKIQKALSEKKQTKETSEESVDHAIAGIIEREEAADDGELVAVIAAAIAASERASSTDGFVVRSIRKIR